MIEFYFTAFRKFPTCMGGGGLINRGQDDASSNRAARGSKNRASGRKSGEEELFRSVRAGRVTGMQIRVSIKRRLADRWPTVRSRNIIHESTTDTSRLWLGEKREREEANRFRTPYFVVQLIDRWSIPSLSSLASFHLFFFNLPPTSPPTCFPSSRSSTAVQPRVLQLW